MAKKEELGKGIRALLENLPEEVRKDQDLDVSATGSTTDIALDQIEVNPFQPRADFDEASLQELATSIEVHGVIQPVTLRRLQPGKYQLISGERRLRASKLAGRTTIPAYVRQADDQEVLEMALIENIQRENLNGMEIAITYKRLMEECQLTQDQLGQRVGKERSTVTNYLRLLKLPPEIQKGIKDKVIAMGHARALIAVEDPVLQIQLYREVLRKGLSVRAVEALAREYLTGTAKPKTPKPNNLPFELRAVQTRLTELLSTKVVLKTGKSGRGQIIMEYYSDSDLNRLLDVIEGDD